VITVGNPSFNAAIKNIEKDYAPLHKSILIISQGTVTPVMVDITKYLSKALPQYTIIFKLHPGEVPFTLRYEELKKYHNVQIKTYENIYELIAQSEIIVGYYSTSLFEAVAFKDKRIFIVDNDMIPDSLGYKFSGNEELCDAILDEDAGYPSADPSYFWEPNWEEKISSFLTKISH
jgi:CDP-glycerol glycerophosphotransferase (TagB/SpsB family)